MTHPKRGTPSLVPEGYAVRSGNPFVAELVLQPCGYRELKTIKRRCCGAATIIHLYCHYYDKAILCMECKGCPYSQEET